MHGDLESLEIANGVKRSDVWFLLNGQNLSYHNPLWPQVNKEV